MQEPIQEQMQEQNPTAIMTATISLAEYQRLLYMDAFMEALIACGVENWPGYADACDKMRCWLEEDE